MILAQHFSEAIVFRVTRLQHISNKMDGIRIAFVVVEKLQQLLGVVIARFDAIHRLLPLMLRFGNQQHGVFWYIVFSPHESIK